MAGLLAIAAAPPAVAGPTGWAHQAAGFQSNGAVTVKSLAGGSYAGTQNPSGAVAKSNQSAATQAPTVIIQATGSGLPFNFKDDCYVLMPPTGMGYTNDTLPRIGAGKIDLATGKFTGLIAFIGNSTGYPAPAGMALLGAMLGVSPSTSSNVNTAVCNNDASCAYNISQYGGSWPSIVSVIQLATKSYYKCYP